jgi:hypothetical protein
MADRRIDVGNPMKRWFSQDSRAVMTGQVAAMSSRRSALQG